MPYLSTAEQVGMRKGERLGLRHGIRDILEIKFGNEGVALFKQVKPIEDIRLLQRIAKAIEARQNVG